MKQKLYEVRRLRFQAWPYKNQDGRGNPAYLRKLPGPTGACCWSTIREHRSLIVKGRLEVWPSGDMKGKFKGWFVAFYPFSVDHVVKMPKWWDGYWFTRDFDSWSSAVHTNEARECLEFIKGGEDIADFFFDMQRDGGMEEDEYVKWLTGINIKPTTGYYICRWDPDEVELPLYNGINVLERMAKGEKFEEILKKQEEKETAEGLRKFLIRKGVNRQLSMDDF